MSHRPERKEKNCLNCDTMVHGKYCHICGQENVEPKETFWGMVTHFFNDITHFDGKFFTTLKDLLFKPGFLSAEYMKGRRVSYLNPVRMYVFTSAIFFLIFFSVTDPGDTFKLVDDGSLSLAGRDSILQDIEKSLQEDPDNQNFKKQVELLKDTSRPLSELDLLPYSTVIGTRGYDYTSRAQYDSIQKARPPGERDNWLTGLWNKRAIRINEKYRSEKSLSLTSFSDKLLHKLPYMLFVSLPFFALILKLLYMRKRKEYYFADHGIFSVHHYILSFILLLFIFLWDKMSDITGWAVWNILLAITIIAWPVYLFLGMKRFYRQNGFKTFVKFLLLNIIGFVLLLFLFLAFLLFSVFQL
jgi:hypothetical protein